MNAAPHTHKITIKSDPYSAFPRIVITYGDQTRHVSTWLPGWKGRMRRKSLRIVATHDKASKMAHQSPEAVAGVLEKERNVVLVNVDRYGYGTERNDAWGIDLLKAPPVVEEPKQLAAVK